MVVEVERQRGKQERKGEIGWQALSEIEDSCLSSVPWKEGGLDPGTSSGEPTKFQGSPVLNNSPGTH